ncbi:MAG: phosphoserine transaminase [Pseudoclavibacter sp.]|nr:phosphoserine transaminase [Pseudoclavibacter sp.]
MGDSRIPDGLLPLDGRFGSGPSLVRGAQIDAFVRASRDVLGTSHRRAAVTGLVDEVRTGLSELFALPDGYEVVLGNGGATAFWDAAAFCLVERRAQAMVFGEFGAKFASALSAPWLQAPEVREAPAGSIALPEPREDVDVYAWPHNETSTGAMAPVRRVDGAPGALTVVDGTSAAGGALVDPAEFDVYYFAPQKNFGADGGLWIALLSPAAIERIERIGASGRYLPDFLSLPLALRCSRRGQTLNTPAIGTLLLLAEQIRWLNEHGGLPWAAERTGRSSAAVYEWALASAYASPFVAQPEHRSSVVATVDLAERVDAARIARSLRKLGVVDVEPYRGLQRNQLRIATFVSIETEDVRRLLALVDHLAGEPG